MTASFRSSFSLSLILHLFVLWLLFFISTHRAVETQKKPLWIEIDTAQDKKFKRQIVQTAPGEIVKDAKPDAFLGEKNQVVEKESVGKKFVESTIPKPSSKISKKEQKDKVQIKELGVPILPLTKKEAMTEPADKDRPEWADQGNVPQDYVRGMRESERTLLNTKEYVFFGYFQRI